MKTRSYPSGPAIPLRAFSLIELLIVIAIMAVLAGLAVPAVQGIMSGRKLGAAADVVASQLQVARQTAITRNAAVQCQILKVPDGRNGDPAAFRVIRSLIMEPGGREWKPLGRAEWLPVAAWVDEDTAKSPMLAQQMTATNLPPSIASANSVAAWVIFDGGGRADVNVASNWLTLVGRNNTTDFVTVQIEPVSGRIRTFRPGL